MSLEPHLPNTAEGAAPARGLVPCSWVAGVGAEDGLGAAIARRHAAGGLHVCLTGRSPERLAAVVRSIVAAGGRAEALPGDLAEPAEVAALAAVVASRGPLHAAVFNAALLVRGAALAVEPAAFEAAWRAGTYAGFLFGQAVLPPLRATADAAARGGAGAPAAAAGPSLVYTGATASLRGGAGFAAFAAAKAGLRAVAQSLAREYAPQGVHVAHVVVDGVIDSARARAGRLPVGGAEDPADTRLQAAAIAETYWQLHLQPRSAWTHELDLRPYGERF